MPNDDDNNESVAERFIRLRQEQSSARPNALRDGPRWAEPGVPIPTNPFRREQPKKEDGR